MGCSSSKVEEVNSNHDEESELDPKPKNAEERKLFLDLNEKECALIKETWWPFRNDSNSRYFILMGFISKNPKIKWKFQDMVNKRNTKARFLHGKSMAYDELVDAMVSWNLRRFSIGFMEFLDKLIRNVERRNFRDVYRMCEDQGARHWRLDRNVEEGNMEALALSIRDNLANYHLAKKFKQPTVVAWKKLFDVVTLRFYRGHERAKEMGLKQSITFEEQAPESDFPVEQFLKDFEGKQAQGCPLSRMALTVTPSVLSKISKNFPNSQRGSYV